MIIFVKLLLAHLIGDFLLQPTSWVVEKESKKYKSKYLYLHILLHFFLAWIIIGELKFAGMALVLAISHGIIDWTKLYFQKKENKRNWFIIDQGLHLIVLTLIAIIWENNTINFTQFAEEIRVSFSFSNQFWLYVTAIVFLTKPTSVIIRNIISIWTPEKKSEKDDSLQNAGNYIGILERLFVFFFIITGHFEAIGFLMAAKSIFRFGDLKEAKDRKLTEYVLIGTFISFGIAFIVGLLVDLAPHFF